MNRLTDGEVMTLLQSEDPLNKARRILSGFMGRIEQKSVQGCGPIEMRRLEFEAVKAIQLALQESRAD